MDRVWTMIYPDGEGVTFSYTVQGPIKTVYGSSTYHVGEMLYSALGQVTDCYLAGGGSTVTQR
jgi:hypothetical protein